MMLDGVFESTGAAGKAQALTDRNDPSIIPEKASLEVLVMISLSSCFIVSTTALGLMCSSNDCVSLWFLTSAKVHIIALPPLRAPDRKPHIKCAQ
jgi:hypothetical protein